MDYACVHVLARQGPREASRVQFCSVQFDSSLLVMKSKRNCRDLVFSFSYWWNDCDRVLTHGNLVCFDSIVIDAFYPQTTIPFGVHRKLKGNKITTRKLGGISLQRPSSKKKSL